MPHLDAAYNLARWLAGNDHDAEDIAQEACVRAFRFVGSFRGGNGRSWLLAIVRNTAYTWLKKNRPQAMVAIDDDELREIEDPSTGQAATVDHADAGMLRAALEELPRNSARRSCCANSKGCLTRKSPRWRAFPSARSCRALPGRENNCKDF